MKNIMPLTLLSFLLLAGCGQSSKVDPQADPEPAADAPVSPSGEPITLHARLDFVDTTASPSINADKHLSASIYIETDVTREGSGASATYSLDGEESRVQGAVLATGSLALKANDASSNETYNMHNEWSALTKNPDGKYLIKLPEASLVGDGLSVGVEIEAPVSGIKKATISSKEQTIESEITHSRSVFCGPKAEDKEKDMCKLTFTIDPAPTKAQNPALESMVESAKTLYAYQGKKNPEGGLIMYSSMVPVYGATTHYHDGHFVTELDQQYATNMDGTDISQHIHLVVWSTKRGDKWQPEGLSPLQKPEALQ